MAVALQPVDQDHRHVDGHDHGCYSTASTSAGSATLRYPPPPTTPTPPLFPHSRTTTPTHWSPMAGGWDQASLVAAFRTMAMTLPPPPPIGQWTLTPLTTPPPLKHIIPPPSLPPLLHCCGNGSTHPVTSIGNSILPGPFHLNDVPVAPHIIHNLLYVRRFTTDNSCPIEFGPFGLSMKDLTTRTLLTQCDSSGPSTRSGCPPPLPVCPPCLSRAAQTRRKGGNEGVEELNDASVRTRTRPLALIPC